MLLQMTRLKDNGISKTTYSIALTFFSYRKKKLDVLKNLNMFTNLIT